MAWGGKRDGAGGPLKYATRTVRKSIRIPGEFDEAIKRKAAEGKVTYSEFVISLIEGGLDDTMDS